MVIKGNYFKPSNENINENKRSGEVPEWTERVKNKTKDISINWWVSINQLLMMKTDPGQEEAQQGKGQGTGAQPRT